LSLITDVKDFQAIPIQKIWDSECDQILAFRRGDLIFVFNFNPIHSFSDYGLLASPGKYRIVLNTDEICFGGQGLIDHSIEHFTQFDPHYKKENKGWLKLYIPARTALVLKIQKQ